ncbi:MAG: recombinase family protein [Clostridia bacterium]|nr:recombinase family protein [Clostridia bacterium]
MIDHGFQRMIKDIEDGKINMVIVKDLSRFGRVSSKVDYYLEEYFIEKNIRFIAVCDDIDTGDIETSQEITQFKTFFNEWFLRDCSKKIKNGKKTRAKEGKVMVTYPAYGYKKDPLDKNHYIVDDEIAPLVKRIFEMAKTGITPTEIAKIMTKEEQRLPCDVVGNRHTRTVDEIKRRWNRNTVVKILKNKVYLGYVKNGTMRKVSYKNKKILALPEEDWILVEGKHTPIIDVETYNLVQEQITSRTATRVKTYDWLLKGILECKECGKKLSICPQKQKSGKIIFYVRCNTYATATSLKLCTPHSNNLEKLTEEILKLIRERCKEYLEANKYIGSAKQTEKEFNNRKNMIKSQITLMNKKLEDLNSKIDKIYDDKYNGIIKDEDFNRIYNRALENRDNLLLNIGKLKQFEKEEDKVEDILPIVKDFVKMQNITRTMLVSLVDKIQVSQDKKVTVYYKFNSLNMCQNEKNEIAEKAI